LFVADVTGGDSRQLTDWGLGTRSAIFSPTDDWIVFDRADGDGSSMWLIRPDGSGERQLWSSAVDGLGCCPTWSPDGSRLLFQRGARPARSLWVLDLDGVVHGRVDVEPGNWIWYRWTPAP
jgi:Tol biopolymer transport system component